MERCVLCHQDQEEVTQDFYQLKKDYDFNLFLGKIFQFLGFKTTFIKINRLFFEKVAMFSTF